MRREIALDLFAPNLTFVMNDRGRLILAART
jgi:hypothetical protein